MAGNLKRLSAVYRVLIALGFVMSFTISTAGQSSKYQEFTVYNSGSDAATDEVIVVFHGFASAIPNGAYKRLYEEFSGRFTIVGLNYDYFDIAGNKQFFREVWKSRLEGKRVIVAGTSLGGFWANYFAGEFGIAQAVLVNPVAEPEQQLRQFIGTRFVEKRNEEITVTEQDVARYGDVEVKTNSVTERLIILSTDDAVLDYRVAEQKFSTNDKNQVLIFKKGGGHTLNLRDPRFLNPIRQFLGIGSH